MDNRGLTPVVSEVLLIGLVLLYIGLVTAVLYGSAIPEYQATSGAEMGDRVLATATEHVQQSVFPSYRLDARSSIALPETINNQAYSLRTANRTLILEHPHPEIGGRARLAVPSSVHSIEGQWRSHTPLSVRAVGNETGYRITIAASSEANDD
ncbi:DUF7266 family protein [Halocatena pleomorpha]|uniref:Uncharacterized protein n=1 Tax=Halocatena pleomorpha TaxID=1785090 RepID=A0A3P3R9N3_9EURY|nr:hypothetical protein [Halocatena pleomorpha]RRJ29183.1 hypothetical protein EIK79_13685 [Halocatena pleomorpha]